MRIFVINFMRRSRIAAIAIVLKTITPHGVRGFESHLLRTKKRDLNSRGGSEGKLGVSSVKEIFKTVGFEGVSSQTSDEF